MSLFFAPNRLSGDTGKCDSNRHCRGSSGTPTPTVLDIRPIRFVGDGFWTSRVQAGAIQIGTVSSHTRRFAPPSPRRGQDLASLVGKLSPSATDGGCGLEWAAAIFVGTSLRLPRLLRSLAMTAEVEGLYRSTNLVIARRSQDRRGNLLAASILFDPHRCRPSVRHWGCSGIVSRSRGASCPPGR